MVIYEKWLVGWDLIFKLCQIPRLYDGEKLPTHKRQGHLVIMKDELDL